MQRFKRFFHKTSNQPENPQILLNFHQFEYSHYLQRNPTKNKNASTWFHNLSTVFHVVQKITRQKIKTISTALCNRKTLYLSAPLFFSTH